MKLSREVKHNLGIHRFERKPKMLTKESIERVRVLSNRGKGAKAISKATGIARNTVRKYLKLLKSNEEIASTVNRPCKLDPYKEQIHQWFLACRGHCPVLLRKINAELKVDIGLRSLQIYCKQWRRQEISPTEMTARYEVPPGNEMQIDFGFDEIMIGGEKTKISFFVAVLSYSRRIFVKIYPKENQAAWLDGIESAFQYFGGVPVAVVSDNTRCLVDGRSPKGHPVINMKYVALAKYWRFVPTVCRPYRAKTKGKVERMVGYVKTSCLSGLEAQDMLEVQAVISSWVSEVADRRKIEGIEGRPIDRFETELLHLGTADRPRWTDFSLLIRKVNGSGLIHINGHRYAVPEVDEGTDVEVVLTNDTFAVYRRAVFIVEGSLTADTYEAITFEHRKKIEWNPVTPPMSVDIQRSLARYDEIVAEAGNGNR